MKQTQSKSTPTFIAKNKDVLVVGGVIVLLAGAAITYYYISKKKQKKENLVNTNDSVDSETSTSVIKTPPFVSISTKKPPTTKPGILIKIGSRHPDVKVLQRYLKIYKEDLGRTGPKRDGVDGIFGPKTAKASQKRLGKTVFTQADMAGMRKALLSLGK